MSVSVRDTGEYKIKVERAINGIEPIDASYLDAAYKRLDNLTKPKGSLGRLEEIAARICCIKRQARPELKRKVVFTIAADHGVCEEGVSAYPQEVTAQMVYNFLRAGAAINILAGYVGAEVIVVDAGVKENIEVSDRKSARDFRDKKVNRGTRNFTKGPAMTTDEAYRAIAAGLEVFEEEYAKKNIDIVGVGEMGIGNTTAASAVTAAMTGEDIELITGRGTGIDDETYRRKIDAIRKALEINRPDGKDAVDVLSKVGGFEIGAIAGVALAAAKNKVPVVVDGFISSCGALIAFGLCPGVKGYLIFSHKSVETGQVAIFREMKEKPLLDLDMRLGEGTGAALGIGIVEAAVRIFNEMATFGEAGVSEKR